MGTKSEPGAFDCHAKAKADEPRFVVLARDALAPQTVRAWVEASRGAQPAEKCAEALACARAMHAWRGTNAGRTLPPIDERHAKARPDEPLFTLLARDGEAPEIVRGWAREARALHGEAAADEALERARAMERWRRGARR